VEENRDILGEEVPPEANDDAGMDMPDPPQRPSVEDEHGPNPEPIILQIAALNDAMDAEVQEWVRHNLHPANLGIVTYYLNSQVFSLIDYLSKVVPNFDGYEFEKQWKQELLIKLIAARKEIVAQQSRDDIVKGIVGPDGKPVQVPKT
jgi:hypothetical protein